MKTTKPLLLQLLLLILTPAGLALLAACGTPAQSVRMSVPPGQALQLYGFMPAALRGQVALDPVQGGEETGRWWGSKVSSLALENALEDSLRAVGLWAASPSNARYVLRAQLVSLAQPLLALDTTVATMVHYTLTDRASGALLYQRSVRSQHQTDFSEALLSPPERTRLANEGAMRRNIELMLRDLPNLGL